MANVTPDFMKLLAGAATIRGGGGLDLRLGELLLDKRALAWAGEYLRSFLGAMQGGPTALICPEPSPEAMAMIGSAMPRLNEAWVDLPDQVLSVRKLGFMRVEADDDPFTGPPLTERDSVLFVTTALRDGDVEAQAVTRLRERIGVTILGGFAIVDMQEEGSHSRVQDAGMPMFYAVTTKKGVVDYKNRQAMLGG